MLLENNWIILLKVELYFFRIQQITMSSLKAIQDFDYEKIQFTKQMNIQLIWK